MRSHPLRLAALLTRSLRREHAAVIRRAGDRLLRGAATGTELAEALNLREACLDSGDPVGVLLGMLRALCDDQTRGMGLDCAVKLAAARDGRVIREAEARAILARHAGGVS